MTIAQAPKSESMIAMVNPRAMDTNAVIMRKVAHDLRIPAVGITVHRTACRSLANTSGDLRHQIFIKEASAGPDSEAGLDIIAAQRRRFVDHGGQTMALVEVGEQDSAVMPFHAVLTTQVQSFLLCQAPGRFTVPVPWHPRLLILPVLRTNTDCTPVL